MNRKQLSDNIRAKRSYLCVGLDTDIKKIPAHLLDAEDPIFEFNKAIIDATAPYCVAYKPNLAFYESYGVKGWIALEKTVKYIKENYPDQFIIADAKRGDIGSPLHGRGQRDTLPRLRRQMGDTACPDLQQGQPRLPAHPRRARHSPLRDRDDQGSDMGIA